MRRLLLFTALLTQPFLLAQLPKPFYPWWNSPVANDIGLTPEQKREIIGIVQNYRPRLQNLRVSIDVAEKDLETEFNRDPVDLNRSREAIERLAAARSDLTKTISQMSLKLRSLLSQQQWQELQKRRPAPKTPEPAEAH